MVLYSCFDKGTNPSAPAQGIPLPNIGNITLSYFLEIHINATIRINSVFNHLGISSLTDVTQPDLKFSFMGKEPAEPQTYGDVCSSVIGIRVR